MPPVAASARVMAAWCQREQGEWVPGRLVRGSIHVAVYRAAPTVDGGEVGANQIGVRRESVETGIFLACRVGREQQRKRHGRDSLALINWRDRLYTAAVHRRVVTGELQLWRQPRAIGGEEGGERDEVWIGGAAR